MIVSFKLQEFSKPKCISFSFVSKIILSLTFTCVYDADMKYKFITFTVNRKQSSLLNDYSQTHYYKSQIYTACNVYLCYFIYVRCLCHDWRKWIWNKVRLVIMTVTPISCISIKQWNLENEFICNRSLILVLVTVHKVCHNKIVIFRTIHSH